MDSRIRPVQNTKRRFGEADVYLHFRIGDFDYLALPSELAPLRERAIAQPEDVPPPLPLPTRPPRWRRVLDALFGP